MIMKHDMLSLVIIFLNQALILWKNHSGIEVQWNNWTSEIQNSSSIGKFKNCIKDHNFYNN